MAAERQSRVERRLAAILAADAAGYSRLMGLDEVGTAKALREHLIVLDALVAKHGGRIVKTTGDGLLIEFHSVVDAVECALAIQAVMAERNDGVPPDRRMLFRVGINLGDVLVDGDDILGDGVNVAARLEGIAEPGGICISSSAYDQVRGKVAATFTDLGERSLKNIDRLVRAYTVVQGATGRKAETARASPSPASVPPRLSIVALPFANIGGRPRTGVFRRRRHRKPYYRFVANFRLVCDRAKYCLYLQRQTYRREADRSRPERPLCSRRLGAARRKPHAGQCSAR
jgi:class 3 adenylate cyclase